ncbi:MAG TPA: hypothetical protein VHQ45_19040, partial [Gemmatimonadaceae bacterium]|nr:hypothetical protein [Gemmatimonadaceae bacterium]
MSDGRSEIEPRAPRSRPAGEWLLRALVVGLLVWFLVQALRPGDRRPVEQAASDGLGQALERWSTVDAPGRVHVRLDDPPAGRARDWLAALGGVGTEVRWSGPSLLPTAVAIEPRADPAGGADVAVAAPPGTVVVLRDTLGVLDSARAGALGVRAQLPRPRAATDAVTGRVTARGA